MKPILKILMAVLAGLSVAHSAGTAAAAPCSGVTCAATTVQRLYPASDFVNPKVFVQPTDGGQAALTCTPVSGVYLTLKPTHPLFNQIYDSLLEAAIHNKSVTLRVQAGSADCEIAYIVVENP